LTGIRGKLLILFIIPVILYVATLGVLPLMEPDEARYSAIPSYMNISGDYVTPRLKGVVYIEKPPLAYWATALSFKIFGENDFSARLFAGLCAWGCILLVYAMGRFFHDEKAGLYGAAVLATSLFHYVMGRINILDMPVAFLMSLAIWAGYRYCNSGDTYRSATQLPGNSGDTYRSATQLPVHVPLKAWLYLCYLACALAFLTKGLIGFVLPAAVLVIWLTAVKRWRTIPKLISPLGIVISLAVSLPWLILIQKAHGDFFRFFFIQEHFQRYTSTMHHHSEPFYFYLPIIIAGTLPWCAFIFKTMGGRGRNWFRDKLFRKEDAVFLLVWGGFILLFFSLSGSKLIPYIAALFLPLAVALGRIFSFYDEHMAPGEKIAARYHLPAFVQFLIFVALLLAPLFIKEKNISLELWWPWIVAPLLLQVLLLFLPGYVRKKTGGNWFFTAYLLTAFFLVSLVFPLSRFLSPYKSAYFLAQAIKRQVPVGQELYQYDVCLYGIDYYDKIRTPIVNDFGEITYGIAYLPPAERERYFLRDQEFFRICRQRQETYCVVKGREDLAKLKKEFPRTLILWDNKHYYLLKVKA